MSTPTILEQECTIRSYACWARALRDQAKTHAGQDETEALAYHEAHAADILTRAIRHLARRMRATIRAARDQCEPNTRRAA